jgi:flagellar basal-body rod protein FlgB
MPSVRRFGVSFGGTTIDILAAALRGLDAQRQAAEHNIANVETPGFRARRVAFEGALQDAIAHGDVSQATIATTHSTDKTRIDGSNVNLQHEVTALELNALNQQLVTQAVNARFSRLRTTIGRG